MINNIARCGNFTSSEIAALMSRDRSGKEFGKPALTYIAETNMERRLGRSISNEVNARPLLWGKLLEGRVFDLLGLEYTLTSKDTIVHPTIPFWAGSPDGGKYQPRKTVTDTKCPMTLKSFCLLVDSYKAGGIEQVRDAHPDGEKYYWQLVSNAILLGCDAAELIVYMPYHSELADIRMMVTILPGDQIGKYYWVASALDDELPYLVEGGYYQNLNILSFDVPESDKLLLAQSVEKAGKMLVPWPKSLPAPDDSTPYEMVMDDPNALKI